MYKYSLDNHIKKFYDIIMNDAISVGIGVVSEKIIDEINILEASRLAMQEAINDLKVMGDVHENREIK